MAFVLIVLKTKIDSVFRPCILDFVSFVPELLLLVSFYVVRLLNCASFTREALFQLHSADIVSDRHALTSQ